MFYFCNSLLEGYLIFKLQGKVNKVISVALLMTYVRVQSIQTAKKCSFYVQYLYEYNICTILSILYMYCIQYSIGLLTNSDIDNDDLW